MLVVPEVSIISDAFTGAFIATYGSLNFGCLYKAKS